MKAIDPRIRQAVKSALVYLVPPAATVSARAEAARDAAKALDMARRSIQRANTAAGPSCPRMACLDAMARELMEEADAMKNFALTNEKAAS